MAVDDDAVATDGTHELQAAHRTRSVAISLRLPSRFTGTYHGRVRHGSSPPCRAPSVSRPPPLESVDSRTQSRSGRAIMLLRQVRIASRRKLQPRSSRKNQSNSFQLGRTKATPARRRSSRARENGPYFVVDRNGLSTPLRRRRPTQRRAHRDGEDGGTSHRPPKRKDPIAAQPGIPARLKDLHASGRHRRETGAAARRRSDCGECDHAAEHRRPETDHRDAAILRPATRLRHRQRR